ECREVAHDAQKVRSHRKGADAADRARNRRAVTLKLGRVQTQTEVRVQLLLTVRPPQCRELRREHRVESDVARRVTLSEHQSVSRIQVRVRLVRSAALNLVRSRNQLLRDRRRNNARLRVHAVNATEVQRARERRLDLRQNLSHSTQLVILVSPKNLFVHTNGLLELVRLNGLRRLRDVVGGLLS